MWKAVWFDNSRDSKGDNKNIKKHNKDKIQGTLSQMTIILTSFHGLPRF